MTLLTAEPRGGQPTPLSLHDTDQRCTGSGARKDRSVPRNTALTALFGAASFRQRFQPNGTILLDGTAADAVYLIASGTVRCCTISEDGQRQIFRFARKGEFVGIADMETWHFTAEAVDIVTLKSIPRAVLERALATDITLRQELRAHICAQLEAREQQLLSLVTSKAPERLLHFLTDFATTRTSIGYITLPMCRRDIADHLGMSVETVSRAFTVLKTRQLIELACAEKFRINAAA